MASSRFIGIVLIAFAAGEFHLHGENVSSNKAPVEPIEMTTPDYKESEFKEEYSARIQEQRDTREEAARLHQSVKKCHPVTMPDIAYDCITSPTAGNDVLLPPFPLAIPQEFGWDSLVEIDLGFVPLTDTIDGKKTVAMWFEKARTTPRLRCNRIRCLELVEFLAKSETPHRLTSWLAVCSRYEIGNAESLPVECLGIVYVFGDRTWVRVPGQCSACGGPEEPESFLTCRVPDQIFLKQIQNRLSGEPWRLDTRLLRDGIVANTLATPARFVPGWEKMTIRLDLGEDGVVLRTIFYLYDRYNTLKFSEQPQYAEIYEKHLRETVADACQTACKATGGTPMVVDSYQVRCDAKSLSKNAGSARLTRGKIEAPVTGSPSDVPGVVPMVPPNLPKDPPKN